MRGLLALLLGFMATAASGQAVWDPPMDKPPQFRDALAFAAKGGMVPIFRDGGAATDVWFSGAMVDPDMVISDYSEGQRSRMACTVPNNARLTVGRVFSDGGKPMFATVMAEDARGCLGVMFYRDLRLIGR